MALSHAIKSSEVSLSSEKITPFELESYQTKKITETIQSKKKPLFVNITIIEKQLTH